MDAGVIMVDGTPRCLVWRVSLRVPWSRRMKALVDGTMPRYSMVPMMIALMFDGWWCGDLDRFHSLVSI